MRRAIHTTEDLMGRAIRPRSAAATDGMSPARLVRRGQPPEPVVSAHSTQNGGHPKNLPDAPVDVLTIEHPPADDPWLFAVHAVHYQPRSHAWFDGTWFDASTERAHPWEVLLRVRLGEYPCLAVTVFVADARGFLAPVAYFPEARVWGWTDLAADAVAAYPHIAVVDHPHPWMRKAGIAALAWGIAGL